MIRLIIDLNVGVKQRIFTQKISFESHNLGSNSLMESDWLKNGSGDNNRI